MNDKTHDVIAHFKHYAITQAQVDACERVVNSETKEVTYRVASATTEGTVYTVRYDRRFGKLACNCMAFAYPTCWHRRAATVAERLFKEDLRAQYEQARKEIEATTEYHLEITQVTAEQAAKNYRTALKEATKGGDAAAKRELSALKRYGDKAYESEGFNLMK